MPRIYTKTGDDGTTGLLYGGRVSKADLATEAYGTTDEAVAIFQNGGSTQDLKASLLALNSAASEKDERLAEECTDEVRLKAACLGTLHLLADRSDRAQVHAF